MGPRKVWELYNIAEDFSQSNDLAEVHPERLATLKALFDAEAEAMSVYPLRDASARRGGEYAVPHSLDGHNRIVYNHHHVRMPEHSVLNLKNVSHQISAKVVLTDSRSEGVMACQGGNMAGWSLYLDQMGCPIYLYNWFGHELTFVASTTPLDAGAYEVTLTYHHDGGFGARVARRR